jgi:hypothetical protein
MAYVPPKAMKDKNPATEEEPKQTPPTQAQISSLQGSLEDARKAVEEAFIDFHKMLQNKRLDKNKSDVERDSERKVADALFKATTGLDQINPGEGVMIAASIALRELLKMRDRLNDIEYLSMLTRQDLGKIQTKDPGSSPDVAKQDKQ